MFCPDCGSEVAEGRRFCGKCGGQLREASASVEPVQDIPESPVETVAPVPRPPLSTRKKLTYALVALLVVLGGVGWWWFHRPGPAYKVQDPGVYPFLDNSATNNTAGTWGFVDSDGKVVIQPAWEAIGWGTVLGQQIAFSEGLCAVRKDGKWGYIDAGGKLVIPNQFDSAGPFIEGLARVNLGSQVGFIDKSGKYVINPQFYQAGDFHDGLAAVRQDGGWGFINKAGLSVIKPHFQAAAVDGFSNGLAGACLNGNCGYIDRSGLFAIKQQFNSVNVFSEGLASVQINGKWGYINKGGNITINPQFDGVTMFSGGLAVVSVSGKTGTIDKEGKYVVNPGQYNIQAREGDLQQASTSDGVGLITRDGKWVVKPSKALIGVGVVFGKAFQGLVGAQCGGGAMAQFCAQWVPVSIAGKVLFGPYEGAVLDSLGQDIDNENDAVGSMRTLIVSEGNYSGAYPAKGFTASIDKMGPTTGAPDENHAGLIAADLATGTKEGYQFTVSIPEGTSTGGTNYNYFLMAKPAAGHAGRTFCADSSGAVHYNAQGENCTLKSPTLSAPSGPPAGAVDDDIPQKPVNGRYQMGR